MKVLLDITYAARAPLSGTAVYLENLVRELEAQGEVEVAQVTNERRSPSAGGGVGSARNAAIDAWWAEVELPRRAREVKADVIHHALPARAHGRAIPQVVTVYDLAFEVMPQMFDRRFATYSHLTYRQAATAADHVIAISHTTGEEVRRRWRIPERRVSVAQLGPGQALPKTAAQERTHFLYVGDAEPRKDLAGLLGAYGDYRAAGGAGTDRAAGTEPVPLILAGAVPDPHQPGVSVEASVDRQRLAELYAGALALVHPAIYEGFGLTLLEGMAAGAPVIAAGCAATVEVGADAVARYPPGDRDALAGVLSRIAGDPAERERLAAAGRTRVEQFSWARCAEEHVGAYSQAVASRRRPRQSA